jgi:hypothetical protein
MNGVNQDKFYRVPRPNRKLFSIPPFHPRSSTRAGAQFKFFRRPPIYCRGHSFA